MRKKAAWKEYLEMRQSARRRLAVSAKKYVETGNARYRTQYNKFMRMSESVIREANKRMRELEKSGLDYNKPYNNLYAYIHSELEGVRRLPSPKALAAGNYSEYTDDNWFIATEQGSKFLRSPMSTVKGMSSHNTYRVEKLQEMEVLPSNGTTWRDYSEFLRFLGSEEVATSIDEYGDSELVVDMLWDYWNNDSNNNSSNVKLMKMAMAQYLSGEITFDEAMRRRGIKIEDYIVRRSNRNRI